MIHTDATFAPSDFINKKKMKGKRSFFYPNGTSPISACKYRIGSCCAAIRNAANEVLHDAVGKMAVKLEISEF